MINDPTMHYLEGNLYRYTFREEKVKKVVEEHCNRFNTEVLNLFAGKHKLNVPKEYRIDLSDEFDPDYLGDAFDFLHESIDEEKSWDVIVYDPPFTDWAMRFLISVRAVD